MGFVNEPIPRDQKQTYEIPNILILKRRIKYVYSRNTE